MIADMLNNKKLNPAVTELSIRGRKLTISLGFITQSSFAVPKNIWLNFTHYFIMKIPNKWELIDFQDFARWIFATKCTAKTYSFLVIDATIASDNPSLFQKNLLERI